MFVPVFMSLWAEGMKAFGPWAMTPLAAIVGLAWWVVATIRGLKAKLAAAEAAKAAETAARAADAKTMLFEMYRVTRETEQARAARRELDERFLPVNEALLGLLAAQLPRDIGPLLVVPPQDHGPSRTPTTPTTPESR